jgi:solute:Na+ symporter, SSS family
LDFAVKAIVCVLYIGLMLALGYVSMKRTKNVGDFFIGGRTLGPWISAMAYGTTYFSAVLFVGFAGKIGWGFGMNALYIAFGNAIIGVFLAWLFLAGPTRDMTERLDAITMPEFLEARYGVKWLKAVAALVVFIFLVPYSASVYQGLGYLFDVNLGIGYIPAIAAMAALTGVYLIMGGYLALAVTDLVRGAMEFVGAFLLVILVAQATGHGVFSALPAAAIPSFAPGIYKPAPGALFPGWVSLLGLVFMTSFGPWGLPQMTQKFYSIKNKDVIKRAMIVATLFAVVMSVSAYYSGGLAHFFFYAPSPGEPAGASHVITTAAGHEIRQLPLPMTPAGKPDFDKIVPTLVTNFLPPWFSVIVLLLVLAASMSSLSSLVLVSSATITVDLVGARDKSNRSTAQGLLLMRVLCGVFVAISVILASRRIDAIVTLMSMSWGALAGAFIGPYVWGLFWRGVTPAGAITGFLGGLCLSVGLFFALGTANAPVAASIAMVSSLILVPVVSLLTPKLPPAVVSKAFGDPAPADD